MALITAAEARGFIPGLTGTAQDTQLDQYILRADRMLAGFCGYPLSDAGIRTLEDVTYTRYLTGEGGKFLRLGLRPTASITSIYDDPIREYGASTLVASGDYTSRGNLGLAELSNTATHGAWSDGAYRAIKATVVCGHATVDDALKQAVGMLVAHWYRVGVPMLSKRSAGGGGRSASKAPLVNGLPDEVRARIHDYRLGGFAQ